MHNLFLTNIVILMELINFSQAPFPNLLNGVINSYLQSFFEELMSAAVSGIW